MEIAAKPLIESQKLADAEGREQKWHCQSHRIGCEQQQPACEGVASGGKSKNGRQDGSDARRPAKRKGEPQQKAAPNARLRTLIVEANVAIQPSPHDRPNEPDQSEREKGTAAESREERTTLIRPATTKPNKQHPPGQADPR